MRVVHSLTWISVDDSLPKSGEEVLIADGNIDTFGVFLATYESHEHYKGWRDDAGQWHDARHIGWWARVPLPVTGRPPAPVLVEEPELDAPPEDYAE